MKLYVARHGRTNYNDLGLCNGDLTVDVHLTETGELQAKSLAEKLSKAIIDQIYISELNRTQQTATFVNKFHNVPVAVDARLNDIRTGFEGKHFTEYTAALDQAQDKWVARFNDGESVEDVDSRVRSFIDGLRTLEYDVVLIVTSEVIVQAIYGILNNLPNQKAQDLHIEQGDYIELHLD